jgi:hypothetical protein
MTISALHFIVFGIPALMAVSGVVVAGASIVYTGVRYRKFERAQREHESG